MDNKYPSIATDHDAPRMIHQRDIGLIIVSAIGLGLMVLVSYIIVSILNTPSF